MSLAARRLEALGIPTLCLGSALDILEAGAPPRAVFVDYPLGHSAGKPFQDRIQQSGFDAGVAVENIGAGYHTLAEAFSGWRDSPPHRANMLNNQVTRMGIAASYSPQSKYKVFWSLILAAPDEHHRG